MHFRCICFFIKLKTQPSKNRNENRRRPERWRSKLEIAIFRWSVYLAGLPLFLCAVKEMGVKY